MKAKFSVRLLYGKAWLTVLLISGVPLLAWQKLRKPEHIRNARAVHSEPLALPILPLHSAVVQAESPKPASDDERLVFKDKGNQLLEAIYHYDVAQMKKALEAGADPNRLPPEEPNLHFFPQYALICVTGSPHTSATIPIVKLLLAHGADPNIRNVNGRTPLIEAASADNINLVRLLLKHGAKVKSVDESGESPFLSATRNRNLTMMRLFVQHGADVNESGGYPLFLSSGGPPEIFRYLLQAGADIHLGVKSDIGVMQTVAQTLNTKMALFMLQNGGDINEGEGLGGETPLMLAVRYSSVEMVKFCWSMALMSMQKSYWRYCTFHCSRISVS